MQELAEIWAVEYFQLLGFAECRLDWALWRLNCQLDDRSACYWVVSPAVIKHNGCQVGLLETLTRKERLYRIAKCFIVTPFTWVQHETPILWAFKWPTQAKMLKSLSLMVISNGVYRQNDGKLARWFLWKFPQNYLWHNHGIRVFIRSDPQVFSRVGRRINCRAWSNRAAVVFGLSWYL